MNRPTNCSPFPGDPDYQFGTDADHLPILPPDASPEETNPTPVPGDAGKEQSHHE